MAWERGKGPRSVMEGGVTARRCGGNVCVELQRRQWVPVDKWNWQLLHRYCERRTLQSMNDHSSYHEIVRGKRSTMAIAFSHDGEFMASGHLTHEIVVCHTIPKTECFQTLSGHHGRTPWCLTFDPCKSHILYSGCLGGTVCKWDVQIGSCLNTWNSGIASPINSIVFLRSSPDHVLVALDHRLFLCCADNLTAVWQTDTGCLSSKVRLVLPHPEDSVILTAITNPPKYVVPFTHSLRAAYSSRTTYRLQVYQCGKARVPNLEDTSHLLLSLSARVYGPHSCTMTSHSVTCITISKDGLSHLRTYSLVPKNFGQCLCALQLNSIGRVVSLDLSLCGSYLLLGIAGRKELFHMNRFFSSTPVAKILEFVPEHTDQESSGAGSESLKLQPVCTLSSGGPAPYSSNLALWAPQRGCQGVYIATQTGAVVHWGPGQVGSMRKEEDTLGLTVKWDSGSGDDEEDSDNIM